jgi:hypothetical protein
VGWRNLSKEYLRSEIPEVVRAQHKSAFDVPDRQKKSDINIIIHCHFFNGGLLLKLSICQ